jgi:hypothetical protein
LRDIWVHLCPGFDGEFLGSLGVDNRCFDIDNVCHSCKELVWEYRDIEIVTAAIVMVWSMGKGVSTILYTRVMFD